MEIELLVMPDCPHRKAAEDLLRAALADVGLPSDIRVLTVTDAEETHLPGRKGGPVPCGLSALRTELPHLPNRIHAGRTSRSAGSAASTETRRRLGRRSSPLERLTALTRCDVSDLRLLAASPLLGEESPTCLQ